LPGSSLRFQIFPTLIRVHDLSDVEPVEVNECSLQLHGPVKDFTVQQNLEKGCIHIWGHYQEGYIQLYVFPVEGKGCCAIVIKRCPEQGILFSGLDRPVRKKETVLVGRKTVFLETADRRALPAMDRLSLGSHKAQDWDLLQRRSDLKEIFPLWLRLGQLVPRGSPEKNGGTALLLSRCGEVVEAKNKLEVVPSFLNLFHAGFEGMLTPRLRDTQHQGLGVPPLEKNQYGSPLVLLSLGAELIRSLFVKAAKDELHVLPALPPEFHCGRYINIECREMGILDIEWTKKTIRRMVLHSTVDRKLVVSLQKRIKTYRLRESNKDRGKIIHAGADISIQSGKSYFFDNFEK
jgi:hypothetical protein